MDAGLSAQDVDQLSQLLGECHLHEERAALAQVMMPIATCAAQMAPGPVASQPAAGSTAVAPAVADAMPWADELMRRLQSCSSPEEGRAACAEAMAAFHQHQSQPALHEQLERLSLQPQQPAAASQQGADLAARLHALQGANRVIVRALARMSERQREQGRRCQQAEEAAVRLSGELQARDEQLHASERAKAMLQSHLQLLLRKEECLENALQSQAHHLPGRSCS
eukprot:gb/GFBE01081709.1/.p1 GENE.gb/GFBE01081709.1/~~gb/GFBE01081709.1/.p1  ORF type:complete len:225 (+),score=59.83 gb/GFBE01081709.1/:1-675(+)